MTTRPAVHVLLLNYNGALDTIACLDSIRRLDYPNLRVIVCDNGSTDDSRQRLREWAASSPLSHVALTREQAEAAGPMSEERELTFIDVGANLGFAGGNNIALRFVMATTPESGYVWLLNNDMVVALDSLSQLVRKAEQDPRIAAVGATIFNLDQPDIVQEAGGGRITGWPGLIHPNDSGVKRGNRLGSQRLDYVSGGCMLLPRWALDTIGLLDEQFFVYSEDTDWCMRVHARGFTVAYCPEAEVWHKGSATAGQRSPFKDFHIVRSTFLLTRKHAPRMLAAELVYGTFRFVLPKILRGDWQRIRAVVQGYLAYRRATQQHAGRDR